MSCSHCRPAGDFPESGVFHIRTGHPVLLQSLHDVLESNGFDVLTRQEVITIQYVSLLQLKSLCGDLQNAFNNQAIQSFFCALEESSRQVDGRFTAWIPFSHMYERIVNADLYEVIQQQLFTTYSQSIIELKTERVYGYEFLLRPVEQGKHFKPYELFQMAERAGLQALLDGNARIVSIKNSARAIPKGIKRFINFLPSSIYDPKHCLATTFQAAAEAGVDPNDLVFEVVETEEISNIDHLKSILEAYQEQGMKVALDDLGAGHSTLSVLKELRPDYVKIDRNIVSFCDMDETKQQMINQIVEVAGKVGAIVLAEGIERKEEAEIAIKLGVQLGQGYYFSKPIPTGNLINAAN